MNPRRQWSESELSLLRSMYPHCHTEDVAAWLDRRVSIVYQAANTRGLRKSDEYLASDAACRLRTSRRTPGMVANQFKPGQAAWNKGLRGVVGVQEACRATQFKPGRKPEEARNYQPIGTIRTSKDGYLERKVTDDQSVYAARRWVAVHRLVWEAERGAIPTGHIVRFKAGQKTTVLEQITADRLECVTRVENMKRNSYHTNYPPEVRKLVQLKGAISRQVNRITKESNERAAHH